MDVALTDSRFRPTGLIRGGEHSELDDRLKWWRRPVALLAVCEAAVWSGADRFSDIRVRILTDRQQVKEVKLSDGVEIIYDQSLKCSEIFNRFFSWRTPSPQRPCLWFPAVFLTVCPSSPPFSQRDALLSPPFSLRISPLWPPSSPSVSPSSPPSCPGCSPSPAAVWISSRACVDTAPTVRCRPKLPCTWQGSRSEEEQRSASKPMECFYADYCTVHLPGGNHLVHGISSQSVTARGFSQ